MWNNMFHANPLTERRFFQVFELAMQSNKWIDFEAGLRSDAGEKGSHTPYDSSVLQLLSPSRKYLGVPVGDETVRVLRTDYYLGSKGPSFRFPRRP